jgi:putative transposase
VLVDGRGVPLALIAAGANEPDMTLLAETLEAVVVDRPEPTAEAPQQLCADKGYDSDVCWDDARSFGYTPHIRARREALQHREQHPDFPPHRWVVEVSHAWLNRFRKLLIRFEELEDSHLALLHFACAYSTLKRAGLF